MRGYRQLKQVSNLSLIQEIKDRLTHTVISGFPIADKTSICGASVASIELSVRQYLNSHLMNKVSRTNFFIGISGALLSAIGKKDTGLRYPLPKEWKRVIRKYGIKVNSFWSSLLWILFVVLLWLYGIRNLIIRVRFLLRYKGVETAGRKCIFFTGLNANETKIFRTNKSSILSKAIGSENESDIVILHDNRQIRNTHEGVQIHYCPLPIVKKPAPGVLLSLSILLFAAVIKSFLSLIIGRWWYAVLLSEVIDALIVNKLSAKQDGNRFFFDQARFIFRPIWTYTVEKRNGEVVLYFYSTNNEYIETRNFHYSCRQKWAVMNWPVYWVWDQYQERFVRNAVGDDSKIEIKGAMISGHDSMTVSDLQLNNRAIAVFDVQPVRDSFYQMIAIPQEYCVPSVSTHFLNDIASVLDKYKLKMLYKSKREIGKLAHHEHRFVVSDLDKKGQLQFIDPNISANTVIERSLATISFPYTSTALLGRYQHKPSVYYDPTGLAVKTNNAACSIPVLCGKDELEQWVNNLINRPSKIAN